MRLRPLLLIVPAVLAVSLLSGASASANAALPLTGFNHMVVDAANSHVFITGAATDSQISVRKLDGTSAGNITGETGAGGMVLSGSTLYVARCGADVIDEIDTTTLTKTGSFAAAVGGTCDLALAGGRLWYSDSTDRQFGHLISVSLDSSHTVIDSGLNLYQMVFATTPVHPDWLVVGQSGSSSPGVQLLDVTDPTNVTQTGVTTGLANLRDLTVSPDGSTLFTASGGEYNVGSWAMPAMTANPVYATTPYPNAVAISPSGTKIAGGSQASTSPSVWVFNTGNTTVQAKTNFNSTEIYPYPRGLAFSPDGKSIFAVTTQPSGTPEFRIIPTVPLLAGSVTLKRSTTTITNGKPVTLTAHLGTSSSVKTVSIYRKLATGTTAVLVHSGKVGTSGNLTYVAHPNQDTIYTVRWAGDATHKATTSAAQRVNVHAVMHTLTQGGYKTLNGVRLYHYSANCPKADHKGCPLFVAYSAPLQPSRVLSFVVQGRVGTGPWQTVLKGSHAAGTNGKFLLTVYYTNKAFIGINQRIRFSIGQTPSNLGATSAWKPFRVTN